MRIMVLGKNGQVGAELSRSLAPLGEVRAFDRSEANFEIPLSLSETVKSYAPDIIVNAAAYTAVDQAEADQAKAFQVNANSVGVLAECARSSGALLVHYSTDYVFDGEKTSAYLETDHTNPRSIYGRSKRAGEEAILASNCRSLILRTSWVYSQHGRNFIKTILRLAQDRDTLDIVADQYGAPTSAALIADVTALALKAHTSDRLASGVYHLTAQGETSWHGLARRCVRRAREMGASLRLNETAINAIPTESYPLPASRPKNSRLNTAALATALGISFPDWADQVDSTVDLLVKNK